MLDQLDTFIAFAAVMLGASLFVTVLVQTLSTVLNLRGGNLRRGLSVLLQTVGPELERFAKPLAKGILTDPLIANGAFIWRVAPAVRLEELLLLFKDERFTGLVKDAVGVVFADPKFKEQAKLLAWAAEETKRPMPSPEAKPDEVLCAVAEAVKARVSQRAEAIQNWFEYAMDRVSQRFGARMRMWTVLFSCLLALAIHLDTFDLLGKLSHNKDLRAQIVASVGTLTKQADDILGPTATTVPSAYREAALRVRAANKDLADLPDPPSFASRLDAEQWLRQRIKATDRAATVVTAYDQQVQSLLTGSIERLKDQAASLGKDVRDTELKLIPDPYPGLFSYDLATRHFWGVLASAVLLSLGAPFWFNLLKAATNLRPIVANKEEQKRVARNKQRA